MLITNTYKYTIYKTIGKLISRKIYVTVYRIRVNLGNLMIFQHIPNPTLFTLHKIY